MSMRSLLIPVALVLSPAALAQTSGGAATAPSVEGYLCTFAGKCDGVVEAPLVTRDAPETKGFRLARPSAASEPAASSVRVQPAAMVMPRAKSPRPAYGSTPAVSTRRYTPATTTASMPGRPRADLMIGFELNSARLSADGIYAAQVFAKSLLLPELKTKKFLIEGHTDLRGGQAVNAALSAKRAQAVADYLVVLGVERARLQSRGLGFSSPLPGRKAADPANRRVEAELIS